SCVTVVQTCALPISRGWSREEFSLGARVHSCRCDDGRYLPLHLCLAHGAASLGVLVNWAWLGGGCRWWAHISREERVSHHRQVAGQVQSLHHHGALPLHPPGEIGSASRQERA